MGAVLAIGMYIAPGTCPLLGALCIPWSFSVTWALAACPISFTDVAYIGLPALPEGHDTAPAREGGMYKKGHRGVLRATFRAK
jgi:hypothetical protein